MAQVRVYTGLSRGSLRRARIDAHLIGAPESTRLILPTQRAVRQRVRQIIEGGHPGFAGRPVLTFQEFAEEILAGSGDARRPVPGLTQHVLMKSAIAQCAGDEALAFLGDAIHTPGFLNHVQRVIATLKQSALEPERFEAIVMQRKNPSPFDAVVARVYRAYQERLLSADACDLQGMYWLADRACREGEPQALRGVTTLLIDGFDDFTPSEFRLIESMAPHVELLVFGMNVSIMPEREDAYELPLKTIGKIKARFIDVADTDSPDDAVAPGTMTERVTEALFARDPKPRVAQDETRNVHLIACESLRGEVETLARVVKRDIVQEGRAPSDIVIALKSAEGIGELIREVFDEAGIPLSSSQRGSLAESAFAGYLLALVSLAWTPAEVVDLLRSRYRRASGVDEAALRAVYPAVMTRAQLGRGENALRRGLQDFLERLETDSGRTMQGWKEHTPALRDATVAFQRGFEGLVSLTKAVPDRGTIREYFEAVQRLLDAHPLEDFAESQDEAAALELLRDRDALEAMCATTGAMASIGDTRLTRSEFARLLGECFALTPRSRDEARDGVLCLTLDEVRHIECPVLYVCGANEGTMPALPPRNAIYSPDDFKDMQSDQVEFETASDHAARERLSFLRIFESATERVTLLWHEHNAAGQATYKSPFILELERLEEQEVVASEKPGAVDWRVTEREAVMAAVEGEIQSTESIGARVSDSSARATSEKRRWTGGAFDAYDGVLDDAALIEEIAAYYDTRHAFSASQLETWIDCPFRFLMNAVLKLPGDDTDFDLLDPRRLGNILHDALEVYYKSAPAHSIEAAVDRMEAIAAEACDQGMRGYASTHPGTAAAEKARIIETLKRHVRLYHHELTLQWMPKQFEVDFGEPGKANPFTIPIDGEDYMITGRIDRVDVNASGEARVVDYKMSVPKDMKAKIKAGSLVQLVLYWMAVDQLKLIPEATVHEGQYQHIGRSNWKGIKAEEFHEIRETALSRISEAITSIRRGEFPLKSTEKACSHCPSRKACRFEAGRVKAKAGS